MKKVSKYDRELSTSSEKEVNWWAMATYLVSICCADVAVHYQYTTGSDKESFSAKEEGTLLGDYFSLSSIHAASAKILLLSSVSRTIFSLILYVLCKTKTIPTIVQPYMYYINFTMTFILCCLTMWRVLLDSEPPNDILHFAYTFLILVDLLV